MSGTLVRDDHFNGLAPIMASRAHESQSAFGNIYPTEHSSAKMVAARLASLAVSNVT